MTAINNSTAGSPATGNVQLEAMEFIGNTLKLDKKEDDAQPDVLVGYIEQAIAEAAQNLSFADRQTFWAHMAANLKSMPNQVQSFITGQNNLYNHNPELQKLQSQLASEKKKLSKDEFRKKFAGLFKKFDFTFSAWIASTVYSSKIAHDKNTINARQNELNSLEGNINSKSLGGANKFASGAQELISNIQQDKDALNGVIKTETDIANQLSQNN